MFITTEALPKENGSFPDGEKLCTTENSQLEVKYKFILIRILYSKYDYILATCNYLFKINSSDGDIQCKCNTEENIKFLAFHSLLFCCRSDL